MLVILVGIELKEIEMKNLRNAHQDLCIDGALGKNLVDICPAVRELMGQPDDGFLLFVQFFAYKITNVHIVSSFVSRLADSRCKVYIIR